MPTNDYLSMLLDGPLHMGGSNNKAGGGGGGDVCGGLGSLGPGRGGGVEGSLRGEVPGEMGCCQTSSYSQLQKSSFDISKKQMDSHTTGTTVDLELSHVRD